MSKHANNGKVSRGTDSLRKSMAELKRYANRGLTMDDLVKDYRRDHPERIRAISTVSKDEIVEPGRYAAAVVKKLRLGLGISQAVFAASLGVSTILVSGWEQGLREPSPLARRLLDIISKDPAAWLASLAPAATRKARKAG